MKTNGRSASRLALLASVSVLALAGCLERKETIRVDRSGAVEFIAEYKGDVDDMDGGDPIPSERLGWSTQTRIETDGDGKQVKHLVARLKVPAGKPLPASYAEGDSELYLEFPTEVRKERRSDGVYYHFRRVYSAREESRFDFQLKPIRENSELKAITGKSDEELTDDERMVVFSALRRMEAEKHCELLRAAAEKLGDDLAPDFELAAAFAVREHLCDSDLSPLIELLAAPASPERDARIAALVNNEIEMIPDVIREMLRDLGAPGGIVQKLLDGYERERTRRSITEDLNDDRFTVHLQMPGELVIHNGKLDDDGVIVWEFPGTALHDRDMVLMATSRVEP